MPGRKNLLIVYHSVTDAARQMAQAAAEAAAKESDIAIRMMTASHAGADDMLAADGYLFCCPENLAAIAGVMKDFFDRSYYPLLGRIEGRAYASMIAAGSDGENAARQIARIATGWRLRAIADPLIICTHAQTPAEILAVKTVPPGELTACATLGATLAAGLVLGIF
jgi:multimeric flavodoxin WrbA